MKDQPAIVALVGLRCSGKTSVGLELARRLAFQFVDLDEEIARTYPESSARAGARPPSATASAGEILSTVGEPAFRDLEERALEAVLSRAEPLVLATGGGVVERAVNRERLARRTRCFWLRVGIPELQRRLRADATARPSLTGVDPAEELPLLAERRDPLYAETAGVELDCRGKSVGEIVKAVLAHLGGSAARGCRA